MTSVNKRSTSQSPAERGRAQQNTAISASVVQTCLTGRIVTAGEMTYPVRRARVEISQGPSIVGHSTTDPNGLFIWCAPKDSIPSGARVDITVRKEPFTPGSLQINWNAGAHQNFELSLVAQGLTD